MFLNFTNHPHELWSEKQKKAAEVYGEIVDAPFPEVDPELTSVEIEEKAYDYALRIINMKPDYVLCQGEFTLAYNVIVILKRYGIKVGAACSKRQSIDLYDKDNSQRASVFVFEQFREY